LFYKSSSDAQKVGCIRRGIFFYLFFTKRAFKFAAGMPFCFLEMLKTGKLKSTSHREYTTMAMSCQERKAAQRARADGYAKSRMADWKYQGIIGATYTMYLEMIVAQHSRCQICSTGIDATSPLDHDHKTGEPRGVLCSRCNLMLGHMETERVEIIYSAAQYLEAYQERMIAV
jgi:hypothetical protein